MDPCLASASDPQGGLSDSRTEMSQMQAVLLSPSNTPASDSDPDGGGCWGGLPGGVIHAESERMRITGRAKKSRESGDLEGQH